MRERFFLILLIPLLVCGCGSNRKALTDMELERIALAQKIELTEAAGGLVLMVGGESIASNEFIERPADLDMKRISPMELFGQTAQLGSLEQFKEQTRDQLKKILMGEISNILLYQYAQRQAGKNVEETLDNAADGELRKFMLDFGGDQVKADEALEQIGMDRKTFKERQKRAILIQWYVKSKLPENQPVTYRELLARYDEMKGDFFSSPAMIHFRLIDIQPVKLRATDPNINVRQLAVELANALLARIKAGEDFGQLAQQYSHGYWKTDGGLWKPVRPASLRAPYNILADEALKIEPNQVAGPIVTRGHVFIMKLEDKRSADYEPFEEVQDKVQESILLDRQNEVVHKINAKLIEQAELGDTDEFVDFCLEEIYKISRNPSAKLEDESALN
jgi:parvulin-like peptidyl-prolyl isomerase